MAQAKKEKKLKISELRDTFVTLYPTAENKYHTQGQPFSVDPEYAKHLIKKGMATETAPEGAEAEDEQE